jgi:hypothetical protein
VSALAERSLIAAECALYGPDLLTPILMAIRSAENGAAGREFGVLSVSAPTYAEQLHIATKTVLHRLWSYPGNPLTVMPGGTLRVSDQWVAWFASHWAPQGVVNDPKGLNANWTKDFLAAYLVYIQPSKEVPKVSQIGQTQTPSPVVAPA